MKKNPLVLIICYYLLAFIPINSHARHAYQTKTSHKYSNASHATILGSICVKIFTVGLAQTLVDLEISHLSKELHMHMLKMTPQEWKHYIETNLLNNKTIESLTPAELKKFFTQFELYQYDGYRLFIATLPGFKDIVLENSQEAKNFHKKYSKTPIFYSKSNLKLIQRYYAGEIKITEQEINNLPEILTAQHIESIIGKHAPNVLGEFLSEEKSYRLYQTQNLHDPRANPLGLTAQEQNSIATTIKNNFSNSATIENTVVSETLKNLILYENIHEVRQLSQASINFCEKKNIDTNLFTFLRGTEEQNFIHKQFVDTFNRSTELYERHKNYSEIKRIATSAANYSVAGIKLTHSNKMSLARAAYKTASSIIALLDGALEACENKISLTYDVIKNPVKYGQHIVDLITQVSSEIALFTSHALQDPEIIHAILSLSNHPIPHLAIARMGESIGEVVIDKGSAFYDFLNKHTLEQASYEIGKEITDFILDLIIFEGLSSAVKSVKLTKRLGSVGMQAARLTGYSIINTPESIEKAAVLLAKASPEALSINPIVQAAITSQVECAQGLKQIGFKILPETVSPIIGELITANGLPKSFIPGKNSLNFALQENGVYSLSKTADIFGNQWQKIIVSGGELWHIRTATTNGKEFLLQSEKTTLINNTSQLNELFIPAINNQINQTGEAILKNGYYEVNGFKFSEYYYIKLWNNGRKAPSLTAKIILEEGRLIGPDSKLGFFRYQTHDWVSSPHF